MRRSLILLPLFALAGCAGFDDNRSYPAYPQYPAYPVQNACVPVSPCSPQAPIPYQRTNYVPQVAQQTSEPPR